MIIVTNILWSQQNSLRRHWMPEQTLVFIGCSDIKFFDSSLYFNAVSQVTFGAIPLNVKYLCYLRTPCCFTDHQALASLPLHRESRDFIRCEKCLCHSQECVSGHILSLLTTSRHYSVLFWLCIRASCKTLYQPLACFEPTL